MKKTMITLFASIFSTQAFAFTNPAETAKKLRDQANSVLRKNGAQKKSERIKADQCVNFSGTWKGQCVDPDQPTDKPEEVTRIINQTGCRRITYGENEISIGGIFTINTASSADDEDSGAGTSTVSLEWNDSQTVLKQMASIHYRFNFLPTNLGASIAGIMTGTMFIEDGKLRDTTEYVLPIVTVNGPSEIKFTKSDCTLEKIN